MTIDLVDQLVTSLNTLDGIEFARDAWENMAPDQYGVVELTGHNDTLWADNRLEAAMYGVRVTAYVKGGSDEWIGKIQNILEDADMTYTFPNREYLEDIDAVKWVWEGKMLGPIVQVIEDGDA